MTGEITLRGKVLPVGGIREKVLAAHRAGIKKVLLPAENEKDIEEIPANVRKKLEFVLIRTVREALDHALVKPEIVATGVPQEKEPEALPPGAAEFAPGTTATTAEAIVQMS
jgi:ATP-dependent Lon protease